jgi:hypothetical protein
MQSLKQCNWILSQSHEDDESIMKMSGRALAKLTRLLCQCKWPNTFYRRTNEIVTLPPHCSCFRGDRTRGTPASGHGSASTCPRFKRWPLIANGQKTPAWSIKWWPDARQRDLTHPRSVQSHVHPSQQAGDLMHRCPDWTRHQRGVWSLSVSSLRRFFTTGHVRSTLTGQRAESDHLLAS